MLDLEAMRREAQEKRRAMPPARKTFLSDRAHARVQAAAAFIGCPAYEVVEQLIMAGLPPVDGEAREEA